MALLVPTEPGSTLVVSSLRSESVKGFVTRVGTRIVKGVSGDLLLALFANIVVLLLVLPFTFCFIKKKI